MITVATTVAPWKCNGLEELAWLDTAEEMMEDAASVGHDLTFFAAIEEDARGKEPFTELYTRLADLVNAEVWSFSLDDGAELIDSDNRLVRICTGRNLAHEFAMRHGQSHILFLDSDIAPDGDCISKLLEVNHPVVGGEVPTYCLSGPEVPGFDFPIQEHWNTAGFLLVRREVFSKLRWRWSKEDGMTDDICFQTDQQTWGFGQTWVRHDVHGQHFPPIIGPVEDRDEEPRRLWR